MDTPEVRITYSRLLDPFFRSLFEFQMGRDASTKYPAPKETLSIIEKFCDAWQQQEKVLGFMQGLLSLQFYQNVIDVHVVGVIQYPISSPMVISSTKSATQFVDALVHELLHRLLSDNTKKIPVGKVLLELFPKETRLCRNHIVVHAVLEKIYRDFFKDAARLAAVRERDQNAPDYKRAWQLVDTNGANKVIARFKNTYSV